MKRERATRILERMCRQIDGGDVPYPVTGLWLFGSYARGAPEPNDIDLLLTHEPFESIGGPVRNYVDERRKTSQLKKALRRPGEPVEIFMGASFDGVRSASGAIRDAAFSFLWSREDREWQSKLAAIKLDSSAGSFAHGLFMKPKRAGCSLDDMEFLSRVLKEKVLTVDRLRLDDGFCRRKTWPEHAERVLDVASSRAGRKRVVCLPYAIQWLLDRDGESIWAWSNDIYADEGRIRVQIGPINPHRIRSWFEHFHQLEAVGQILHFKRDLPRELLVFRKGERWNDLREVLRRHHDAMRSFSHLLQP